MSESTLSKISRASIQRVLLLLIVLFFVAALTGCASQRVGTIMSSTEFDAAPVSDLLIPGAVYEPEPERQQRALISFAGDCIFSSIQGVSTFNEVYNREGPAYFLSGVSEIFANDDLTIVNLESPLTTATAQIDKGEPVDDDGKMVCFWFKAPPKYVKILTSGSVEMCNLANNHILDYDWEGYRETQKVLKKAGIDYFVWDQTIVKDVNGIKIGFFGFSFDSNAANIRAIMDELWENGAEVIVAYFHDGTEENHYPNESQRAAAYAAADYGASAVIMSHAHVLQGVEEYNGTFIAWGLGNFCYGGYMFPPDEETVIVQLEFIRTDEGISCTPTLIPCLNTSNPGTVDFRPMVLTGKAGKRVLKNVEKYSK